MQNSRFVVLDVETTGLWPKRGDRIIEIGAITIENGILMEEFTTLIDINRPISREAQKIHGITKEMLTGQPRSEEIMPQLAKLIAASILVAHNAKFDMAFLHHEFHRLKIGFNHRFICTLEMSQERFPNLPNHRLGTIYRHLIGTCPRTEKPHRALADASMTAAIWLAMERK